MPFTPPSTYASKANTGYEATLEINTGSPASLVAILELKSIKNNFVSVPEVITTHLLSPKATEELQPGLIKPGTLDVSGNFIGDSSQLELLAAAQARANITWSMKGSVQQGAKTYTATGAGYIAKYENGGWENNRPVDFMASIQINGAVTETVA